MLIAKRLLIAIGICFAIFSVTFALAEDETKVVLKNDDWMVNIYPKSLQVTAQPKGKDWVQLSAPQKDLDRAKNIKKIGNSVSWEIPEKSLAVSFQLDGDALSVQFRSDAAGSFTWPFVSDKKIKAYILPLFEGSYVPSDDSQWLTFLVDRGPMNTTEGLSMPFWGLDCGDYSLTYILTNQFTNDLSFEDNQKRLAMRFTHNFTKIWKKKEYGLLICLDEASPVASAKRYRQWLIQRGDFVSMQEKIRSIPDAEKLLGAAQIYLWGGALLSRYDILDWRAFTAWLVEQGKASQPSPAKRIWELMSSEARKAAADIVGMDHPHEYIRNQVTDELSRLLEQRDFYHKQSWDGLDLNRQAIFLLDRGITNLTDIEVRKLNCMLLEAAFGGLLAENYRWGNGISVKMMEKFAENGFDRLWLGMDSWEGALRHPQAIEKARELEYLIGPYDSYHSIHHPNEPDTWETAQFDLELYETGGIVRADGKKRSGFQQKGYLLSPFAAKPYVEKRVSGIMSKGVPLNSWFIDCDAYGELFDDYSPLHPATQEDDMNARLERMAFIRDKYKMVIGSEGGSGYAAPVIHFAHGMMTPGIGWGDPDVQKDKESKYYVGGYWPPDGPAVHIKQVPLKEKYRHFYFDPRFRLPLYQTVFHDSVVTTHWWGSASLKFMDQMNTIELLELLYNVPPLYHMNLKEFEKHRDRMKAHYAFFSPLHRELGLMPMTDFAWLTPNRMVQRTVFGDQVEVVANFSAEDFDYQGDSIPARSVMAKWRDTGRVLIFTPPQ